jgi:hypothetical protein
MFSISIHAGKVSQILKQVDGFLGGTLETSINENDL